MGFIVGDILAQRLTGEAFDAVRSLELGLYGTLLGTFAITMSETAINISTSPSFACTHPGSSVTDRLIVRLCSRSCHHQTLASCCAVDGPIKHMFNKTVDKAVGSGTRAKLARAAADNYIWMPVTTCLLFAALKLAQGQPEEIVSSCQVSFQPHCQCAATCSVLSLSYLGCAGSCFVA